MLGCRTAKTDSCDSLLWSVIANLPRDVMWGGSGVSFRPREIRAGHLSSERFDEVIEGTVAGGEFVGTEQQDITVVGLGDNDRRRTVDGSERVGLVVAMVGVERHREPRSILLPLLFRSHESVGDVAQGAVSASETRAEEVREFPAHVAVGVVDPDQSTNGLRVGLWVVHEAPFSPTQRARWSRGGHINSEGSCADTWDALDALFFMFVVFVQSFHLDV
jgi:hypothetical protein